MVKTIEVQVVNSREDLKKCKPGEIIYIEGRIEIVVNPDSPYLQSKCDDYDFYTISKSVEEGWFIQHQYSTTLVYKENPLTDQITHNWKDHLCKIDSSSNKELESTLNKIINKTINKNAKEKR